MTSTATTPRMRDRSATARRQRSSRPEGGGSSRKPTGPSTASRRAYDRRERRRGVVGAAQASSPRNLARRIPFVVLILALFAGGMGLTLWLTTSATARSHGIAAAEHENTVLEDKKEALEQVVQAGNSAPELARKAAELGMVQAEDVAHLVVAPDGSVTVVGEPEPARGPVPHDLARVPEAPEETPAPASQPAPSHSGASDEDEVLPPADAAGADDTDVLASSPGRTADDAARSGPEDAVVSPRRGHESGAEPDGGAVSSGSPATDAPPIPPAHNGASDAARGEAANAGQPGAAGAD